MTLVPTLNRLKLLERFLKSAIDCETSTPGLVIVDHKDWEKNSPAYSKLELPNGWSFTLTDAVKMGDKIREVWPMVLEAGAKWVNILNDDHVICTKNWDTKLVAKLDGTNFVTCNDRWMSPRKAAGATMFSMPLLEAVGFPIYPPGMEHLFIDDLWESIAQGTGIWDIDHSVVIEHHNQLKDPAARDNTFYEVYGRDPDIAKHPMWQSDQKVYQAFMKNDYVAARNKIRKLRGQLEIKMQS